MKPRNLVGHRLGEDMRSRLRVVLLAMICLGLAPVSDGMPSATGAEEPVRRSGCCDWKCDWQFGYPKYKEAGSFLVYSGYALLFVGVLMVTVNGFRQKSPGMPLIGLCSYVGVGLIVLPHVPPLDKWITTGAEHLFPGYASAEPREYVAW